MLCYRFSSAKGMVVVGQPEQAIYHPMGVLPQHRQFTTQWAYCLSPTGSLPPNGRITSALQAIYHPMGVLPQPS